MVAACIALAGCAHDVNSASEVPKPGPPLPSRPGATVWGVGIENLVLASHDGGATWTVQHREPLTEQSLPLLWNVAFGDARHGWAADRTLGVSSEMTLLATTDGGVSWEPRHLGALASTFDVVATDARHVWALGERHDVEPPASLLMATSDGGKSWHQEHVTTQGELSDIAFSDARHGWAVADGNRYGISLVYSTADGGRHWRLRHIARDVVLRRLATSDAQHCWLVGAASHGAVQPGEIVATSDGGDHWTTQVPNASEGFDDVAFPDARHGWAVGLGGLILDQQRGCHFGPAAERPPFRPDCRRLQRCHAWLRADRPSGHARHRKRREDLDCRHASRQVRRPFVWRRLLRTVGARHADGRPPAVRRAAAQTTLTSALSLTQVKGRAATKRRRAGVAWACRFVPLRGPPSTYLGPV